MRCSRPSDSIQTRGARTRGFEGAFGFAVLTPGLRGAMRYSPGWVNSRSHQP